MFFFQNYLFQKILSETLSVWIQIRAYTLLVLVLVQTDCIFIGYQQTAKVTASKERVNITFPFFSWVKNSVIGNNKQKSTAIDNGVVPR